MTRIITAALLASVVLPWSSACAKQEQTQKTQAVVAPGDSGHPSDSAALVPDFQGIMAPIRDSAGVFDPGGYYYPDDSIAQGGDPLRSFELRVANFYYGGSLHYDRPQVYAPPLLTVEATGPGSAGACRVAIAVRDSLDFTCSDAAGSLQLTGHFVGVPNSGLMLCDSNLQLLARVIVRHADGTLQEGLRTFTCYLGD